MNNYEDQDLFSVKYIHDEEKNNKTLDLFHFSYSKFSLYKECPLKYKFKYIDKIKEKPKPFFFLGSLIHKILYEFYRRTPPPQLEELINIYVSEWNSKSFEEKGYIKEDYDRMDFNKGIRIIKNFYDKHKDNKDIPFQLEYGNYISVDGLKVQIIADKIEYIGEGKIIIVDYKTGKSGERTNEQLYFYQKIVELDKDLIKKVEERYKEKIKRLEVEEMLYYYVEELKEVRFKRADEREIGRFWEEVLYTVEDIKSQKFDPKPSEKSCGWCDFKTLCPIYEKRDTTINENLIEKYMEIKKKIEELEIEKKEIENKIIKEINKEYIEIDKPFSKIKINKIKTYEFDNREEIIKLLKKYNLYNENILRPTIQSLAELIENPQTPAEFKEKIKNYSKINWKLKITEEQK